MCNNNNDLNYGCHIMYWNDYSCIVIEFFILKDFVFPVDISSILYYNTCEKNHLVSDSIQNLKSSLN